jgi:hypothetical protein
LAAIIIQAVSQSTPSAPATARTAQSMVRLRFGFGFHGIHSFFMA